MRAWLPFILFTASCAPGTMHRLVPGTAPSRSVFTPSPAVAHVFSRSNEQIELHWSGVHHHLAKGAVEAFADHLQARHLFRSVKVAEAGAMENMLRQSTNPSNVGQRSPYIIEIKDFVLTTEIPSWANFFRMIVFLPRKYSIGAQMIAAVGHPLKAMRTIKVAGKHEIASLQVFPKEVLMKAIVATIMDVFDQTINQIDREPSASAEISMSQMALVDEPKSPSTDPSPPASGRRPWGSPAPGQ